MSDMTERLVEAAQKRLQEFGIALEVEPRRPMESVTTGDAGIDAFVTLSHGNAKARYAVIAKSSMTLNALMHRLPTASHPPLMIGDHISRRSASALRDAGIQFIDASGNAFIKFDSVLIEVQGRTYSTTREHVRSDAITDPARPTNIFSPRRAQVILALLAWPELGSATVRDIADAAGVSVGQAHDALAQLEQAEFILPSSGRLQRANELLDYWTAAYPNGLGRRLEIARYHGDPARRVRKLDSHSPIYLSGESAEGTDIARPATLTIYVDTLHARLPIENRWSSNPDQQPNIFVRRKFWTSPHASENESSAEERNAPWPLVYADLVATGDARLREVAKTWRARCARPDDM